MDVLEIYLFTTVIPNISASLQIIMWSGIISLGVNSFMAALGECKFHFKKILPIIAISMFFCIFVPNRENLKIIVVGSFLTNIENIEKLPENTINFLNKFLEETTKEEEQ